MILCLAKCKHCSQKAFLLWKQESEEQRWLGGALYTAENRHWGNTQFTPRLALVLAAHTFFTMVVFHQVARPIVTSLACALTPSGIFPPVAEDHISCVSDLAPWECPIRCHKDTGTTLKASFLPRKYFQGYLPNTLLSLFSPHCFLLPVSQVQLFVQLLRQ